LLIDDAQNTYAEEFGVFWQLVVKDVGNSNAKGLHVVIAATYDLSTPVSLVNFRDLEHIDPNMCEVEGEELIKMHLEHWRFHGWDSFSDGNTPRD